MAKLYNLARMNTATTGTGSTIALGAAVAGYLTFALAGAVNGDVIAYAISDGANSESGTITYSSTGPQLTGRTPVNSTNGNAAIALSGTAQVFITAMKEDIANLREANTFTAAMTLNAALTYGGVTLSNAVTGTGNMVLSANPTFTGTVNAAGLNLSGGLGMNFNNASIEIGLVGTSNVPFIDWHSSAFSNDYDVRLQATGGTSTNATGTLLVDGVVFRCAGNDQATLGISGTAWADLFLASGGTINWAASNTILTQSSNTLTLSGSSFMSLFITSANSSTTNPATFGMNNLAAGNAARWLFGDVFSAIQNSFGSRMQIYAYHGIEIIGATANNATTPAFVTGGAAADSSLAVYGITAATLAVGRQGPTNPAFAVDSSATTVVTGIKIAGAAVAGRALLSVISTGTDEGLSLDAKGAGTIRLGATSTGAIEFSRDAVSTASGTSNLGTTALAWGNLFLKSTGKLDFANGNMTLTHATGSLAFNGGKTYFLGGNGWVCSSTGTVGTQNFDGFTPAPQVISNFQDTASIAIGCWVAGNSSGRLMFGKSRNATVGTNTACTAAEHIGEIQWCMADGASTLRRCAELRVEATGTASTTSVPTKMFFVTTPSASVTPSDAMTLDQTGAAMFPRIGTTATAANAFVDNANSNNLLRSTSSIRYKKNITEIPQERIDAIKKLRLVEFSSLASMDNPEGRFVGLVAEDVAAVDSNLVIYGYDENDLEINEKGARVPKPGARQKPDGVQYDRVLLLQIAALQQRIETLESLR